MSGLFSRPDRRASVSRDDPMRRFSIALTMTIISLIAADMALVKASFTRGGWPFPALLVITLPMANLMLLSASRLRPGRPGRWFWIGFDATGVALIFLSIYLDLNFKDQFVEPIEWVMELGIFPLGSPSDDALALGFTLVAYTPPQLLAAWIVGRLTNSRGWRRPASHAIGGDR